MLAKFHSLSGSTLLAGVVGWPVAHSQSPRLHGYWLARTRIDGVYLPLAVQRKDFDRAVTALPLMGFAGVNVTVPHKEAALAIADEADEFSKRIGAANTLVFSTDGRISALNTDGHGFIENMRDRAPAWRADAGPAVVLGAGGASRAVIAALLDAGAPSVRLVNRTRARAEAVADALGSAVEVGEWDERAEMLRGASTLVNTTSLGMAGAPPLDLDLAALPHGATVSDIVYAPLETPLLLSARHRGLTAVDGVGMLLHQARPGFAAWFRENPVVDDALRSFILKDLSR